MGTYEVAVIENLVSLRELLGSPAGFARHYQFITLQHTRPRHVEHPYAAAARAVDVTGVFQLALSQRAELTESLTHALLHTFNFIPTVYGPQFFAQIEFVLRP